MAVSRSRQGILIIISSPSGAGKTSVSKKILGRDHGVTFSVSATTRKPRSGEIDGKEYFFISKQKFEDMISRDEFLEYAEVFGNIYGTPRKPVEKALRNGQDVLFDVDWQGGLNLRKSNLKRFVVSIFILPPSILELNKRLISRGQDSNETVRARMLASKDEISHWQDYDYVLVNENLDEVHADIKTIIRAERLKRVRQSSLRGFIKSLNKEFKESF